jgi:hypothetical protein
MIMKSFNMNYLCYYNLNYFYFSIMYYYTQRYPYLPHLNKHCIIIIIIIIIILYNLNFNSL